MRAAEFLAPIPCALAFVLASASSQAQGSFPADVPGTNIGGLLPAGYEASGALWHPRLQQLFVVSDDGWLTRMEASGALPTTWVLSGDFEAVCVADPKSDYVYIGQETPNAIHEFDFTAGQITRTFNLDPWTPGPANQGLEGLAFVPDARHPEGGRFHAGLQHDGTLHVFDLPIHSSASSTLVTQTAVLTPIPGRTDLSDLTWDAASGRLYALWDTLDRLSAISTGGTLLEDWPVPGIEQEGIAVRGCELYIAEDQGAVVWKYTSFPSSADCEPLSADSSALSTSAGGVVHFELRAVDGSQPGHLYLLLGSANGEQPGLAAGAFVLPLNLDGYLLFTLQNPGAAPLAGALGIFPANGKAAATFSLPAGVATALVGTLLHHAYVALDLPTLSVQLASNSQRLELLP